MVVCFAIMIGLIDAAVVQVFHLYMILFHSNYRNGNFATHKDLLYRVVWMVESNSLDSLSKPSRSSTKIKH